MAALDKGDILRPERENIRPYLQVYAGPAVGLPDSLPRNSSLIPTTLYLVTRVISKRGTLNRHFRLARAMKYVLLRGWLMPRGRRMNQV